MGRSELLLDYFLVQPWSESVRCHVPLVLTENDTDRLQVKGHFGLIDVDGEGWAGFIEKIEGAGGFELADHS